jgi:hypothetical protein
MKVYEYKGKLYRFADDKVPAGAVLHGKEKPVEVKQKKPANKARKARSTK